MSTSDELLRLLDPAVRPVGVSSPSRRASAPVPFERQNFDELLEAFGQAQPSSAEATPTADVGTAVATNPAHPHASATLDVSRIENASLLAMIAQRHGGDAQNPTT
ncbi:MAG: hypothetical protein AAGE65_02330 [Planctomycetota bacterium]